MPANTIEFLQRIRTIMPDLRIEHFEINQEGTLNNVVIVNQDLVFRFAKNEAYARTLQTEIRILDFIRPKLDIRVPAPIYTSADCMVYPLLPGQPLLRKAMGSLDQNAQQRIADQLGNFLIQLHSLDTSSSPEEIPLSRAPYTQGDCMSLRNDVREKIYPLLQKDQIEWAEELFNGVLENPDIFNFKPSFIHGDLASYHILFDERDGKITGVFDFGMAGIGDQANDFGNLINFYGETFVRKISPTYPGLQNYLPRSRYYAQALELEWILRGLESGEAFWFTAHLGRARDILS